MPGFGCWQLRAVVLAVVGAASCSVQASAQSLEAALAYAYANNPQLNAQRAQVRATDENVPTALAGYRPRVSITANAGTLSLSTTIREICSTTPPGAGAS
jgi:outer membrane protein